MIAPIAPSPAGIAAIPPGAFRLLSTGVPAARSSTVDGLSSVVDLSATGQVLSAVSAARNRLAVLQETPDDASSGSLLVQAQSFVDTVNALRSSVTGLQTAADVLPGSLPGAQLSATANNLASTALAAASSGFDALRSIGIAVQAPPSSIAGRAVLPFLSLDENALLATDPAAARARLDQAALELSEQLTGFESQVTRAAIFQAGLTQLGSTAALSTDQSALLDANTGGATVSSDLLQRLPADAVLNDIQLSDLDLAATGLDATTLVAEAGVTPAADLLTSALADLAADIRSTAATNLSATAASALLVTAASPPNIAAVSVNPTLTNPVPTAPASTGGPAVNQGLAPAVPALNADAIAAERQASEATLALQNLLANPTMRAFDVFFDPAYSALIAAAHMGDFVVRAPVNDPRLLAADFPGPVLPVTQVRPVEGRF